MGKKIYVGNMSFKVGNGELEAMFATYGKVESAQVITDRVTGRSKGFGFVEMSNDSKLRLRSMLSTARKAKAERLPLMKHVLAKNAPVPVAVEQAEAVSIVGKLFFPKTTRETAHKVVSLFYWIRDNLIYG